MIQKTIIHLVWIICFIFISPCFGNDSQLNPTPEEQVRISENHNPAMVIRSDWPESAGINKAYVLKWISCITGIASLIVGFVLFWNKRLKTEIVIRKKIEEELRHVENALEKRVVALTRPLDSEDRIDFGELFNLQEIQQLQDEFAQATGVASIITHTDGKPITTPSNFCHLCRDIIRKTETGLSNCFKSDAVLGRYSPDGPIVQTCLSGGLWDAGAAITIGGRHIANWLIGQVRDQTQTDEKMRAYARLIGADEDAVAEAFRKVPSMSREQFEKVARMLFTLANHLSTTAYQNVQQARFIHERKQAEEDLRESEEKFRLAFLSSPDSINLNRVEDGVYLEINEGFTKIMGYSREETIGKSSLDLNIWNDPKDRDRLVSGLKKEGVVENLEAVFRGKNGQIKTGLMSARVLKIGNEDVILSITRDITDAIRMEAKLQQSQKMEAIGTLAGGIAHDFNNILSPIVGYTELLLDDFPDAGSTRNSLNAIYSGAFRARDLVQQILSFARREENELKLMKLQPIIKEAMKLIRATIPTTIAITQHLNPDCGPVSAEPTQIHQIVMNLATNAYHAMAENGGELKVNLKEIELGKDDLINPDMSPGLYACLSFADTGMGMNRDVMNRIFDPFFTTKEKGKGTGMGLSVVHGIVKHMKGDIQVYSEPGKGTEFRVYLPVVGNASEKQESKADTPMRGGCERLLLVDDEESIIVVEKQVLERLGYQVTSRTSSIEALEAFRVNPDTFDLVITDMSMPKMSGDKLANELIKIRPDIPILLCTGFSETMTDEKMKSMGVKGILMKPMMMKDLAKKIREVLDGGNHDHI